MEEIWKDVKGYEGKYYVSNLGRVKSFSQTRGGKNGRILANKIEKAGYYTVGLWSDVKRTHYKIHRLVAIAFIENPLNKPQVNHIDGNKLNNLPGNLEWVTCRENIHHAIKTNLSNPIGESNGNAKLTDEDVSKIREMYSSGSFKKKDLANMFGINRKYVTMLILNKFRKK